MSDLFDLPRDQFEQKCKERASGVGAERAVILGGLATLDLPPKDEGIAEDLCRDGFWESWITLALARLITPGMVCWNIGANVGYYTALMALRVGEKGRVVAFEPNFQVWSCLARSAHQGAWGREVDVVCKAVSDVPETEGRLYVPGNKNLNGSLLPASGCKAHIVSVTTLAHLLEERSEPSLIFCDAEGAEERIFLGSRLFDSCRPIVSLEFTPSKYQAPRALLAFFKDLGYLCFICDFDGQLRAFDAEVLIRENLWAQLVFLPERPPWRDCVDVSQTRHSGG